MSRNANHLLNFIAIALAVGWIGIGIDALAETPAGEQGPGMLFWLVAPLASIVIIRWRGDGWKDAGLRPHVPEALQWYLVAMAIPIGITLVGATLGFITGQTSFDFDFSRYLPIVAGTLAFNFIKNIFEEFAWRGYLASKLIGAGLGDITIYLVTGVVWGLWHVPYYLSLLDGDVMEKVLDVPRFVFAIIVCFILICWTVTLVELMRLSNSVWPAVVLHTVHNTFIDPLQPEGFLSLTDGGSWWFSPVAGIVTGALYLVIGFRLRAIRLARP